MAARAISLAKARDLIAPVLGTATTQKLIDTLLGIETVKDPDAAAAAAEAVRRGPVWRAEIQERG